jgi:hypothetical protein
LENEVSRLITELQNEIAQKDSDIDKIADRVVKDPKLLDDLFMGLNADKARIKYGCEKVLRKVSEKNPATLYPRFDFFAGLLDSENNFLKWGAILTIGNLAAVDSQNKFEAIFDKYFAPIPGPELIPAGNVIGGAAKIALAKPHLTGKISKEILKVERARYQTTECRNIALGHAIKSFDRFFDQIVDKEPVVKLIRKQLKNTRNATRKKAEKFLNKWQD